jgi:hypothetical protein
MANKKEQIWDGKKLVNIEDYVEQIKAEQKLKSVPKQDIVKQVINGLFLLEETKITGKKFDEISKAVKEVNEVKQSPSLTWMMDEGYIERIKIESHRPFYVITKKGVQLAEIKYET